MKSKKRIDTGEMEFSGGELKIFGKTVGEYGVILTRIDEDRPDEIPEDKQYLSFLEIGDHYEEDIIVDNARDYIKEKFQQHTIYNLFSNEDDIGEEVMSPDENVTVHVKDLSFSVSKIEYYDNHVVIDGVKIPLKHIDEVERK